MKVKIFVKLKESILDPQGKAVDNNLHSLGMTNIHGVRVSKYIELELDSNNIEDADNQVHSICDKILANSNTESYTFQIEDKNEG